jgi:hypothetical protein
MVERPDGDIPSPLPRDWLPRATAPESAPEWDVRVARIVATADPALWSLRRRATETQVTWPTMLGSWWKPAAALAAAASGLLFLFGPSPERRPSGAGLPLSVVAAQGDPVALWEGLGIEADPVLAVLILQERSE